MRVFIIGGPGSGKTTLAERLGARLGAPSYDLDWVGFRPDGSPLPREEQRKLYDTISSESAWIAAGNISDLTAPFFDLADAIVWLDLPRASRAGGF